MRQYSTIKKEHPSALLFFRLGDFYEMFFDDAVVAAKELLASINPPSASAATNYWSVPRNVGDYGINYLLRALVAEKALGANSE